MSFVEWKGEKLLKIEVKEFSYMEDLFDSSIEISLFPNEHHVYITESINKWTDHREEKNLIIYYKDKNSVSKYYYLKSGKPSYINIGIQGKVNSCKFVFKEMKEISRPLKISEILRD